VPGFLTEVHNAECDWADDGLTNVNDLRLACHPHNVMVRPGGWRTRKLIDSACLRDIRPGQGRVARLSGRLPRRARGLARRSGATLLAADVGLARSSGRLPGVCEFPGDRTVLRHNHIAESGQGVWGTPQRWRKSTEGCRMV
jgi:hypothetical protein